MSGFSFPPPPPPPPKASAYSENSSQGQANRRGRGNFSGNQRATGNSYRGRHDGPNQYGRSQTWHRDPSTNPSQTNHAWAPHPAAVRPPFQNQQVGNAPIQNRPSAQAINTSPRTVAGHKRKLEALRGPQTAAPSLGPPTAPSVPTFGAPILPTKPPNAAVPGAIVRAPSASSRPSVSVGKGFPHKANALGLTPDEEPQYSSSEHETDDPGADEDVDEEAMAAELGTKLNFEHNGTIISLSSPADLARWKSERLKNFPTRTRMAAKEDEKRAIGDMRKRLLVEAVAILRAGTPQTAVRMSKKPTSEHHPAKNYTLQAVEGDVIVAKTSNDFANNAAKSGEDEFEHALTEQSSLDHNLETDVAIDDPNSQTVEGAPDASDGEESATIPDVASEIIDKGTLSESDDGPPESVTSKQPVKPAREFPPAGKPKVERNDSRPNRPRRPAAPHVEKRGIYQALIEQEQHDQHVLALAVIKSLGRAGFFTCSD